jgi:hypothetical protein
MALPLQNSPGPERADAPFAKLSLSALYQPRTMERVANPLGVTNTNEIHGFPSVE